MKGLIYTFLLVVLSTSSLYTSAQLSNEEVAGMYAKLVAELNTVISSKACEKTWKEQQEIWTEKANSGKGIGDLCGVIEELQGQFRSDKGWAPNWPSKKNKWNKGCEELKKWDAFGNHLIEFEGYLNESAWSKRWSGRRKGWLNDVQNANAEYLKSEKIKNPDVNIDKAKFDETFDKIFRTSIAGLSSLKKGNPITKDVNGDKVTEWATHIELPSAAGNRLEYSKRHDLHSYVSWWRTGTNKSNAMRIMGQVGDLVDAFKPVDFNKRDKYSSEYIDYKQLLFEFNSDKFADLQKRPTVIIGVIKEGDGYAVQLKLTEPYFKNQYKY